MASSDDAPLPPLSLVVRQEEGVRVLSGESSTYWTDAAAASFSSASAHVTFTTDGSLMSVVDASGIRVVEPRSQRVVHTVEKKEVTAAALSPLGRFLVTWERPPKKGTPDYDKLGNVCVWQLATGDIVTRFFQKEFRPAAWPPIKWTPDERLCARLVTNELRLFEGDKPHGEVVGRMRAPGVGDFEIAPVVLPAYRFSLFVPEKKGQPARILIFTHPDLDAPSAQKSFFKAETVKMRWSPAGNALLVQTATDHDQTGKTYYGESGLHLMVADGSFTCTVPFVNKGPIHDAQFGPTGKDFLVLQGNQPADAVLFKADTCTPIYSFGAYARNTIRFSPHGRFICLGGFGNLPGEMEFWDVYKRKLIGRCQDMDGAKSYEWSPDGRTFVTAALHPWRRVDNGFKVWSYAAELLHTERIDVAYQVVFVPVPPDTYPDRPQSPRLKDKRSGAGGGGLASTTAKKAYVPPHLRGKSGSEKNNSLAARMKHEKVSKAATGARKIVAPGTVVGEVEDKPPELSKSQKKAMKRREKAARDKAEAERKAREAEEAARRAKEEAEQAERERLANMPPDEKRKKDIKKLQKKLKQIDKLRKRRDVDGEILDDAALEKIASEDELRAELAQLEAQK